MEEIGVPIAFLINAREGFRDDRTLREWMPEEAVYTISALDPVSSRHALESFVQAILRSRPAPVGDHRSG
jgi:hypothetical protein